MYIHRKLKQLEEMGINSPSELADLLIKGVFPNGKTLTEQERNSYTATVCGIVYETAAEIRHIQKLIND